MLALLSCLPAALHLDAQGACAGQRDGRIANWACYYGSKPVKALSRFDLVVLESFHQPAPPKRKGRPVALGYASLGEVDMDGRYWELVKDKPFVLDKNPNWNSRFVDVRDPGWRAVMLERIVPDILARGYDGVFLDTLDSSIHLESVDPERFKGMASAAAELVAVIKRRFPEAKLCLNRAAPILETAAPILDFALLECLYSDYDFEAKSYRLVDARERGALLESAARARRANPAIVMLSLDYADPKDARTIRNALAFSRKHKLVPYVSTPELDAVHTFALGR
ncbi:MAG: endo alpha-1,4 polygalactosaminidase [Thermodesulfobacteriota bacterium]